MTVTVLGAGAWGTALGRMLALGGHAVTLWGRGPDRLKDIASRRMNARHLPDIALPPALQFQPDLSTAISISDCVVLAVPSKGFREIAKHLAGFRGLAVSVTKGIEYETGLTMCGLLQALAPNARVVALSGPTLALEVASDMPAAAVAASLDDAAAREVQKLFHRPTFRVYTSGDVLGVELGGALKNVVAIAAGVGDGLGFGDNSKAALVTRGIVEIRRLGVACGAQTETFSGLSGLGDLTLTCYSRLSRNRAFGEHLGKGQSVKEILAEAVSVAEGYPTARAAYQLARRHNVETPIIDEVHALLYEGKNVVQALRDLTTRESKAET